MERRLEWKAFDTFEEMSAFSDDLFSKLTPEQRIERFFVILQFRLALGIPPKAIEKGVFILRKNEQ